MNLKFNHTLFAFILCSIVCSNSANAQTEGQSITVGFNFMTPLGSVRESNYTQISNLSSNTCASVHFEYRKSRFAFRTPIRIPLTHLVETTTSQQEYYANRLSYTNFEIGFLPTLYFLDKSNPIQFYSYLGLHLGNSYGVNRQTTSHYALNTITGLYDEFLYTDYSRLKNESRMYTRYSLGTGISHQFANGFGLEADLSVFFGKINDYLSTSSSNQGTSNGAYTTHPEYSYRYTTFGVQFGFNLTYQLL